MCSQFGSLLSERMIEFGILIDKIQKKEVIYNGIFCSSKKSFLKNYLISLRNLMVLVTAYTQALQYVADISELEEAFTKIKKIFKDDAYISYFEKYTTGIKILLIFELLQNIVEDFVFIEMKNKLIKYIGSRNGEKYIVCTEVLDLIYDLGEIAILNLSGLRINCFDVQDTILADERFKHMKGSFSQCNICQAKSTEAESGCCGTGFLHIFMHEDLFAISNWIETYFNIITKYHVKTKDLRIIFDYKLLDEKYEWTQKNHDLLKKLEEKFLTIYFINTEKIDFSSYSNEINIVDYESIKCSLGV